MAPRRSQMSRSPLPADPVSSTYIGGTAGWAPFGAGQHASAQIGAYDGVPLNQFPAYIPGVQLHSGREWGRSQWYYPSVSTLPQFQQSQQLANLPGGQRRGSQFTGPIGPITARLFRSRVSAASVRQTSLMAQPWAQLLTPQASE